MFHDLSELHLGSKKAVDRYGKPIFFCSLGYLEKFFSVSKSKLSERIAMLAFLGLIRKVPDNEIPGYLYEKANEIAIKNRKCDTVQFYSIPSYSTLRIGLTSFEAKRWKKQGLKSKGVFRKRLEIKFGNYVADRAYPKRSNEALKNRKKRLQAIANNHQ